MKCALSFVLTFAFTSALCAQHEHHHPAPAKPKEAPQQQPASGRSRDKQAAPSQQQGPQPAPSATHDQRSVEELIRTSPSNLIPVIGTDDRVKNGITLAELEEKALRNNPTVRQAESQLRAAKGRHVQAGLLPNPTIGYTGDEIRGGQLGGGAHGFFFEQAVPLGGKLTAGRRSAAHDVRLAEVEVEEQKMRVQNAVRIGYYQVLAAQEMSRLDRAMVELAGLTLTTARRLQNIGQNDFSEVLQSEIELKRAEVAYKIAESRLRRDWASLTAAIGEPSLEYRGVQGRLDEAPGAIDVDVLLNAMVTSGPATRLTQIASERAEAELSAARRFAAPDLIFRGGLQHNNERADGTSRALGAQGFAEVGITLPLFNRNQGNVQAAQADIERARLETQRTQLALRQRAADVIHDYTTSLEVSEQYRREILPRAQELFAMQLKAWGQMRTSYPQVLTAQRGLFDAHAEYIRALEQMRTRSVALQGFLLTDGLELPASPAEVSTPVRELNMPRTGR